MPAKTIILASFAAMATVPTFANAAPAPDATTVMVPAAPTATSRADNPAQRYCIDDAVTGSRIRRVQCETLSRWQSQGVDPRLMPRRK